MIRTSAASCFRSWPSRRPTSSTISEAPPGGRTPEEGTGGLMLPDLNRVIEQVSKEKGIKRDIIYNEFKGRKGELVSGIVQRFEKKNIIVNLGRTDAILPEKEQIPRERYRQGDRIRAFILDVELAPKGPQIVLSRTHPGLLI